MKVDVVHTDADHTDVINKKINVYENPVSQRIMSLKSGVFAFFCWRIEK